jgi:hypothetical protein
MMHGPKMHRRKKEWNDATLVGWGPGVDDRGVNWIGLEYCVCEKRE